MGFVYYFQIRQHSQTLTNNSFVNNKQTSKFWFENQSWRRHFSSHTHTHTHTSNIFQVFDIFLKIFWFLTIPHTHRATDLTSIQTSWRINRLSSFFIDHFFFPLRAGQNISQYSIAYSEYSEKNRLELPEFLDLIV